jgi:hypothetical protein
MEAVELDDAIEERLGDGQRGVGVTQENEVHHLGETVNDRENDGLTADLGKSFNEIRGDVAPD